MTTSILLGLLIAILIIGDKLIPRPKLIKNLIDIAICVYIGFNVHFTIGIVLGTISSTFFFLLIWSMCYVSEERGEK